MEETPQDLELFHYGVKGMKWGVRRDKPAALQGVPRSTNRVAKRDARESAKAKMFYGEGAGTRRKLIKAKVESRSKDAAYKRAMSIILKNRIWLSEHRKLVVNVSVKTLLPL